MTLITTHGLHSNIHSVGLIQTDIFMDALYEA